MKRAFLILLLALSVLVSGCGVEPAESSTTREHIETAESSSENSEEKNVPETEGTAKTETRTTEETLCAPETEPAPEPFVQKGSFCPGSIRLNPAEMRPEGGVWALGGSKVYFGHFAGVPTAYRVLSSPDTQTVLDAEDSLLLDCDTVLERRGFDDNFRKNETQVRIPSEWEGSDIELWLNGSDFYGSRAVFSPLEKAAIADTVMDEEPAVYTIGKWTYEDYGAQGHIFLLSAAEAEQLYTENAARFKTGDSTSWWLRSSFGHGGNGTGSIHGDGHICNNSITNFGVGVSPALNVRLSSILFVSPAGGEKSPDEVEEWKLTLLDANKTVKLADGQTVTRAETEDGTVITVPYTCDGEDITQISILITDKEYSDTGAQVLYYGAIQPSPTGTTGEGAFILPADLEKKSCGRDYFAYILAEDVNGEYETNYASGVYMITIPAAPAG